MIFSKEDADTKARKEALRERKARRGEKEKERAQGYLDEKPTEDYSDRRVFTWENLNYHVPVPGAAVPGGTKRLLHDVNGYVKP